MNNQIKQLWYQALDKAVPETYTQLSAEQLGKAQQVFAELIVQECIEQIRARRIIAVGNSWNVDETMGIVEADIEDRFGINYEGE